MGIQLKQAFCKMLYILVGILCDAGRLVKGELFLSLFNVSIHAEFLSQ